uniref:Uncharacterized protein n=1 Tax=Oryza sativa subsp. japonica TaxID=39947 RepID=Q6YS79_ORYSJ|nr:hypothetical protein [Oryza sativa Japonica Group]
MWRHEGTNVGRHRGGPRGWPRFIRGESGGHGRAGAGSPADRSGSDGARPDGHQRRPLGPQHAREAAKGGERERRSSPSVRTG